MIGQQELQIPLAEKSTPHWHKSPSLSSATTTDEDWLTGSPKTRWADLSDEDDELGKSERSPFGFLQDEVKEVPLYSAAECADKTNPPHAGDEAHYYRSGTAYGNPFKFFEKEQHDFVEHDVYADSRRYNHDRKSGRQTGCLRGTASPFTMLPPTFDSPSVAGQAAMVAPQQTQRDAPQNATTDVFTVTLSGIPPKLCNDACLDAIFWASGVQRSALAYHTKKNGYIVINFGTSEAATHCYNHFKSCSWATGKLQVDLALPNSPQLTNGNARFKQDSQSLASHRRHGKNNRSPVHMQMW